jgi:hypothetical protein
LNLTGHILLGLGLATSLLLYMFINALENKSQGSSSSYGYGAPSTGYGRKKVRAVINMKPSVRVFPLFPIWTNVGQSRHTYLIWSKICF